MAELKTDDNSLFQYPTSDDEGSHIMIRQVDDGDSYSVFLNRSEFLSLINFSIESGFISIEEIKRRLKINMEGEY